MNIHAASNLDIEKFRKVYALVTGGATDGERAAAKARASTIAERAGMSLSDVVSKLDGNREAPKASNFFSDLFNTPEFKAQQAERNSQNAIKRAALIREYGSEDALFADTANEILLSKAVDHLKDWRDWETPEGVTEKVACGLAGWIGGGDAMPQPVRVAVSGAIPIPEDLAGVLAEYRAWDKLYMDRSVFTDFEPWYWVEARTIILREILDARPVRDWLDMLARMDWWEFELLSDVYCDRDSILKFQCRIVADMAILMALSTHGIASTDIPTHRTNADKRAAVLSMLDISPELSDREISRRTGVSPQTVGNWRRRTLAE